MQKLRIFVASPSDMLTYRNKVREIAASLKRIAEANNLILEVADWSSVVPDMGRPEQVILDEVQPTTWDVFIGILWLRFGTPPNNSNPLTKRDYMSGTEEEFDMAYRLWKEFGRPRIMIYRCTRDFPANKLDLKQYAQVEEFFKQFDASKGEHPGLYYEFKTTKEFNRKLIDSLQKMIIEYRDYQRINNLENQHLDMADAASTDKDLPGNLPVADRSSVPEQESHKRIKFDETLDLDPSNSPIQASEKISQIERIIPTKEALSSNDTSINQSVVSNKEMQDFSKPLSPTTNKSTSKYYSDEQSDKYSSTAAKYLAVLVALFILIVPLFVFSQFSLPLTVMKATPTLPLGEFLTKTPTTLPTSTPYISDIEEIFYCYSGPNMSSEARIPVQRVRIIAKSEDLDWLYVEISGYSEPCWIEKTAMSSLDNGAVLLLPVYSTPIVTITPDGD